MSDHNVLIDGLRFDAEQYAFRARTATNHKNGSEWFDRAKRARDAADVLATLLQAQDESTGTDVTTRQTKETNDAS